METRIIDQFRALLGKRLITETTQLRTYECDGLTNFRVLPQAVLLPESSAEVQRIVQICSKEKIPFVARGSGTGLSGGALPVENGIVIRGLAHLCAGKISAAPALLVLQSWAPRTSTSPVLITESSHAVFSRYLPNL